MRMQGKVIRFNRKKGYGFIKGDDAEDRFVHATQVRDRQHLLPGQRVTFEHHDGPKGPAAVDVEVVAEPQRRRPMLSYPMPEEAASEYGRRRRR